MAQPHRPDRVRLAALTPLFGYTAATLDEGGDALVAEISAALRRHAATFDAVGVAAVYEQLAATARLDEQLLAIEGGERALTDLRHLAQLLNRAATCRTAWPDRPRPMALRPDPRRPARQLGRPEPPA